MSEGNQQKLSLQYVSSLCACLGAMCVGTTMGFTSPAGPILANKNATLYLTDTQLSWFSSSINIGGMAGSLVSGHLMSSIGRRGTMMTLVVPMVIGWILIAFAQNFMMLLLGRLIHGFSNGIVPAVVPAYIGEISSPKIRGKLGSGFITMAGVGLIYVNIVGALIKSVLWISIICIPIPIIYCCAMYFLPESPSFLMTKGKTIQMEKTLRKLNGVNYDISMELESLREMSRSQSETTESFSEKLAKFKDPSNYKPLLLIIALYFFMQFSGMVAILFNLGFIFEAAGTNVSPDMSTIIYCIVYTIGCVLSAMLVDKTGRKILQIYSSLGSAITLCGFGVFFYLKELGGDWESWVLSYLSWMPLVCLITYVLSFIMGIGSVPFVMAGEVFPSEVLGISTSIGTFALWLWTFLVTVSFLPLKTVVGNHGIYFLYGVFMLLSFFYCIYFVPETKGKSKEEIGMIFSNRPLLKHVTSDDY